MTAQTTFGILKDSVHYEAQKEHLGVLELSLSNEKDRLRNAKKEKEIALRTVWVSQYEKQIAELKEWLGIIEPDLSDFSDDDLLAALGV